MKPFKFSLFVFLMGMTFYNNGYSQSELKWGEFDERASVAAKEKKYIFVEFYADWCSYCKMMDETTLVHKDVVKELKENFVVVKINTESKEKLYWDGRSISMETFSAMMGVESLPTMVFLNSKQEVVGSHASFVDAKTLLALLTYISSGAREKNVSLDEFLESKM